MPDSQGLSAQQMDRRAGTFAALLTAMLVGAFLFVSPLTFKRFDNATCTIMGVEALGDSAQVILDCGDDATIRINDAATALAFARDPSKNKVTCTISYGGMGSCQPLQ